MNYYNEFDPRAADKLESLIQCGLLAPGYVDRRSIVDVMPCDMDGYDQCHFFAGYGGWPLALALAGWAWPIWSGSAPCQPFSCAGKHKGLDDERHLWPHLNRLIEAKRPTVVVGEQVARAIGKGWLDVVSNDFKSHDYEFGATVFKACSCGSPTERERLYWAATDTKRERGERLVTRANTCVPGQRHWGGKEDLRRVYERPVERGDLWPQPIIRKMDDGVSERVGRLRGYGNAVDIRAAVMFIRALMGALCAMQEEDTQ